MQRAAASLASSGSGAWACSTTSRHAAASCSAAARRDAVVPWPTSGMLLRLAAALGMVERRVSMAPVLRRLLGLLRLPEGALLLALSLVAIELGRRNC